MLKSALLAGASPINGPAGAADNDQGFGRVNLDAVIAPPAPLKARFVDGAGLGTGAQADLALDLDAGQPLKVVLAYSDYPGEALVNNLNLIVTGPEGMSHVGNAAGGANAFDSRNNIERVFVPAAAAGAWRVRVVASNVPQGPQPYGLTVIGALR